MTTPLAALVRDESGATAIEYGVVVALVAALVIPAASMVGAGASEALSELSARLAPPEGPAVRLQ